MCGGVGSLLFCTTLLIYLTLWLVLAGLLCWHAREHLGLCLGLSFWMILVVYFQNFSVLSPWNALIPAVYRAYPPSYILLDWLLLLPLLLFLGLAVRAACRQFDRPALLRLGLAVGLFATATFVLHLLRIPALISLSFGLDRLVFFLSPDHMFPVFLFYYWPLLLLLFYLAAAWAGAAWERRAARRS